MSSYTIRPATLKDAKIITDIHAASKATYRIGLYKRDIEIASHDIVTTLAELF